MTLQVSTVAISAGLHPVLASGSWDSCVKIWATREGGVSGLFLCFFLFFPIFFCFFHRTLVLRSGLHEKAAYQVFFCVFFFFPIFFCFFPRTLVLRSELQEKAAYQVFCVCVFVFFVCVLCVKIWATREGGVSVFFSPYFSLFFSCFACLLGLVYVYIGLF